MFRMWALPPNPGDFAVLHLTGIIFIIVEIIKDKTVSFTRIKTSRLSVAPRAVHLPLRITKLEISESVC